MIYKRFRPGSVQQFTTSNLESARRTDDAPITGYQCSDVPRDPVAAITHVVLTPNEQLTFNYHDGAARDCYLQDYVAYRVL